jgi:tetratricopeptide (TPR) repeat protein
MRIAVAIACVVLSGGPAERPLQAQGSAGVEVDPLVRLQIQEAEHAVDAAIAGKASDTALAEAHGLAGRIYHAYELFEPAEQAYRRAARLAPRDGRWPHLLGYLYQQTGRFEAAVEMFAEARRLQPANHPAAVRLGQSYLGVNRLREAQAIFESVRDTFPALARQGLGEVALRQGRHDAAVTYFLEALDRVPEATSLHYQVAMAYRGLGRLEPARLHLARKGQGGIRVGDPLVDGLQDLVRGERGLVMQGRRAYEAGQFTEAAAAFTKAVAAAPASATARFNLGLAILQLGDPGTAIAHLQAAFALDPDDAAHGRELARLLVRSGRTDPAIEVLTSLTTLDAEDEDSLVSLAILLADARRYRDAIARLDGAARRVPGRMATATTLARLLASVPDRSLRDGQRALDLAMTVYQQDAAPAHAETVAMAFAELARCDDAVNWIRRAIADAGRRGDTVETQRLTGELPRYQGTTCRRP